MGSYVRQLKSDGLSSCETQDSAAIICLVPDMSLQLCRES